MGFEVIITPRSIAIVKALKREKKRVKLRILH
jgi:hypothetical protein